MNHTKGQVYPDGTVAYYKDAKAREMISTDYDSTASYAVGDYCMYDNVRYCCNTAIGSGGETWNSSHWDEARVDDDITEIKSSLSDLATDVFLGRTQSNLSTTAQNVSLSDNFNNYMLINIEFRESSNVYAAITLTSNYINVTTSTSMAQLYVPQNGATVQVYKNTNNSVYVKTSTSFGNTYNVAIRGIIKKANN